MSERKFTWFMPGSLIIRRGNEATAITPLYAPLVYQIPVTAKDSRKSDKARTSEAECIEVGEKIETIIASTCFMQYWDDCEQVYCTLVGEKLVLEETHNKRGRKHESSIR